MYKHFAMLAALILVVGCDGPGAAYQSVKNTFYGYNYYSNLDTYRPASWRPVSSRYSQKELTKLPPKRRENWKNYKVGSPYQIAGVWYYPKEDPNYVQEGIASWYGPKFHNKLTANGEIFNKYEITAAHNTLPMPSMVRVTNLENGRSLLLRVNDRGPFAKNRIIDLSEKAAEELGFKEQGTARVRVEFDRKETEALFYDPWDVEEKAKPKLEVARHINSPFQKTVQERMDFYREHFVQAGAYSSWDSASDVADGLKRIAPVHIKEASYRGGIVYRVRLGPFETEERAGTILDQIAMMGFNDAIVMGE